VPSFQPSANKPRYETLLEFITALLKKQLFRFRHCTNKMEYSSDCSIKYWIR